MTTPRQLKELYEQGQNISAFLRKEMGVGHNTRQIIEISYDLQTGSYIDAMKDEKMSKHKQEYTREIAVTILSLYEPKSILEAGVEEATTFTDIT